MRPRTGIPLLPAFLALSAMCAVVLSVLKSPSFFSHKSKQQLLSPRHVLADLPPVGLAISIIQTEPPFLYTYMTIDADSYQVASPDIRALEPGMTALWGRFVGSCCKQNGHVVDVGSHFGYYSLYSAALGCTYSAIEPVNTFRAILNLNIRVNGFERKGQVYAFAAGNKTRPVNLVIPDSGVMGLAHVAYGSNTSGQASHEKRLDDELNIDSRICGLKIDVEGYEPYALDGAAKLLKSKRVPFVMMEFSPNMSKNDAALGHMLHVLHQIGYSAFEVDWARAKQQKSPNRVDTADLLATKVDIGSQAETDAFIARVRPNTNLWLSLE
jgi:FkbM family methyltransferase